MVLLPIFGYISDKIPLGREVMLVYGMRGVAVMAFCFCDSLNDNTAIFTLVMIQTLSNLQAITIESLFTKRLPGDIRGALTGVKTVCAILGKLFFVGFSQVAYYYFDHVYMSMEIICMFDAAVFALVLVGILMYGWDYDVAIGYLARSMAERKAKKFNKIMRSFKDGELLVT